MRIRVQKILLYLSGVTVCIGLSAGCADDCSAVPCPNFTAVNDQCQCVAVDGFERIDQAAPQQPDLAHHD